MSKILRPTTIIPPALYVERSADRQVSNVISDMGRPGYVLVSRQMGKTNLLINAKREMEGDEDVFVYVDLSANYFDNPRDCFRHIVDIALGSRQGGMLKEVSNEISENRLHERSLPAAKEHERELRGMLSEIPGKLIIILDEIDSLTKTDFSDQVFAFIRSIYFSRINYLEYERLTYVLSGVAEPADIIKDKSISPFNIGQKIYLDDFTLDETREFITNAKLDIEPSVIERTYWWTSGNPRLLWDLCSAIEDKVILGVSITNEVVDSTVADLYLCSFDKEPIDHIRQLVGDSKDIRSAISQISYGKGHELSDKMRSKLYLAGVIGGNFSKDKDVRLKNPIVEAALSDKWLQDIERSRKGLLDLAEDKYKDGAYEDAIGLIEEFFDNRGIDENIPIFTYHRLGSAYFMSGMYSKAIESYEMEQVDKRKHAELYFEKLYQTGIAYFYLEKVEQCIAAFKEYVEEYPEGSYYHHAKLNLSSAYFKWFCDDKHDDIEKINKEIIKTGLERGESENEIVTFAYLNLARLAGKDVNNKDAVLFAKQALKYANPGELPSIYLEAYSHANIAEERREFLASAVESIYDNSLHVKKFRQDNIYRFSEEVLSDLLMSCFRDCNEHFERLLDYAISEGVNNGNRGEIFFALGMRSLRNNVIKYAALLFEEVIRSESSYELTRAYSCKFLWYIGENDKGRYLNEFMGYLESHANDIDLDEQELNIVINAIVDALDADDLELSDKYVTILGKVRLLDGIEQGALLLARLLEMRVRVIQKSDDVVKVAWEILNMSPENLDFWKSRFVDKKQVKSIQEMAQEHCKPKRKILRNEKIRVRYPDGFENVVKYKNVEDDVTSGQCAIVELNIQ